MSTVFTCILTGAGLQVLIVALNRTVNIRMCLHFSRHQKSDYGSHIGILLYNDFFGLLGATLFSDSASAQLNSSRWVDHLDLLDDVIDSERHDSFG